jgi:hypothetical protein
VCPTVNPLTRLASTSFAVAATRTQTQVLIVDQGEVGPYMYQVIVALESDVNGDALFNWMNENKFDIPGKNCVRVELNFLNVVEQNLHERLLLDM